MLIMIFNNWKQSLNICKIKNNMPIQNINVHILGLIVGAGNGEIVGRLVGNVGEGVGSSWICICF